MANLTPRPAVKPQEQAQHAQQGPTDGRTDRTENLSTGTLHKETHWIKCILSSMKADNGPFTKYQLDNQVAILKKERWV